MRQLANEWDAAIADYSETIKLNPTNYIAHNGRGWMHIQRNELDKALADFDRSIEINRSSINALAFAHRADRPPPAEPAGRGVRRHRGSTLK